MKQQPFNKEVGFPLTDRHFRKEARYAILWQEKAVSRPYYFLKRIMDTGLAIVLLVFVLSWLIPLLCLIIFIDTGAPMFFVQKRVGLNGKIFFCYKLRTMYSKQGNINKKPSRLGQLLRDHKLDELPQIVNVLRGDMSMVGPRPHMLSDHEIFSQAIGKRYHLRHVLKPGITGLAQIGGYEGSITSLHKLRGRIRLDLFYIKNWSLGLDFLIIFKTIGHILKGILRKQNQEKKPEQMVHHDRNK
ncbi:MAG: hypothetical protein DHS20C18_15860 [Saprospiraceae bacterium]|nr:MAG: hypothetical protein DHS20C18_15860 [Saprospiraceae bacterium]